MDVFQDGEMLYVNDLGGEFKRLGALGYDLRIANVEELEGGDQIIVHHIVVGLFTEEQLRNFDADPRYGYAFGCPASPDGTALSPADLGFRTSLDCLTGHAAPPESALSPEEARLLAEYRRLSDSQRRCVRSGVRTFLE